MSDAISAADTPDTPVINDVTMEDAPPAESTTKLANETPTKSVEDSNELTADPGNLEDTTLNEAKNSDQSLEAVADSAIHKNAQVSTPASKKDNRRKSAGNTSSKKFKGKKAAPDIHVNVSPGEHWFVRMKGYTPWPAVICSEDMLPLSLLEKRPVSAMRADGTWRADFEEGGKNLRDRRYPVLFLGTFEFGWQVNTDLLPLDVEDVKETVRKGEQGKKSKALWSAFELAAENHELDHFKNLLSSLDEERKAIEAEQLANAEAAAEKKAKASTPKKKKDENEIEPTDTDGKKTKKRKKEEEEGTKTKIVLKGLKSAGESEPAPKKQRKSKGADAVPEEPQLSPEEILKRKGKHVLFLRHKLQKGLVLKEVPAKPEEMESMAEFLTALESFGDLEASIIRETSVAKLLKVILKANVPRDDEFHFKDRCGKLLAGWTTILAADDAKAGAESNHSTSESKTEPSETEKPITNGNHQKASLSASPGETESATNNEKKDASAKTTA